jgi:hypothetical protein
MPKNIQARFVGVLGERREERINSVLQRFDAWKHQPSGYHFKTENGDVEIMHTAVEWIEDKVDGTTITICEIEDDKAERITSELRACGLVVTMPTT